MDIVKFHFNDPSTNMEVIREYEVSEFDEAVRQYHSEFPDNSTRPRVFRVSVRHMDFASE